VNIQSNVPEPSVSGVRGTSQPALIPPQRPAVPAKDARVLQLDILRGVAILLVLGAHSPSVARGWSGMLRPVDIMIHRFGWTGVDLFFVLSGFLIGGLLFAELKKYGTLDVGRFLIRRILRIWPPYYILLMVVLVRTAALPGGSLADAWSRTWMAFVHVQNFIECPRTQLWSLAVEEHFYVLLPLFLWALTRNRGTAALRYVPWASAILSVGFLLERYIFASVTQLDRRIPMDALFFGVNLAYLHAYRPTVLPAILKYRVPLLAGAALLFIPSFLASGVFRLTFGLAALYVAYAIVLVCFIHIPAGPWIQWRATRLIAYIGTYSYSIYLWHRDTSWEAYEYTLKMGMRLGFPHEVTWVLHTIAYVIASIVGGIVLGNLIEGPVQRLREKLFPPRAVQSPLGDRPIAMQAVTRVEG